MTNKKDLHKPYDFSLTSIGRGVLLVLIPLVAYILGAFPVVVFVHYALKIIPFSGILHLAVITILLVFSFFLLLILETFIPGIFIRIFKVKVPVGTHEITIKDKGFFNHMLFFILYRPALSCTAIVPLVPLRLRLLKLVGLRIGDGSLIAGTELIDEPYAVEIGKNTLIGGFSTIFAHISHKKLFMKTVKIGDNCFIGNKSIIMPGVIIENNVVVQPGSVVVEDQLLKKGKRYAGNPAIEIKGE